MLLSFANPGLERASRGAAGVISVNAQVAFSPGRDPVILTRRYVTSVAQILPQSVPPPLVLSELPAAFSPLLT